MSPFTKKDMQLAVRQLRLAILGQIAIKKSYSKSTTNLGQQTLTVTEMQLALDASRERFIERLGQPFKQQQVANQAMMSQLDTLNRRLLDIEYQLQNLSQLIKIIQQDADILVKQPESQKTTLFSQMFS